MKINICLSTYNGEKYLAEQIESILQQTYQMWNLLIRDDCSTDNTRQIIEYFAEKDARIHFINQIEDKNIGAPRSFYELVKFEKADFYLFSDQDDVWKKEKLEHFLIEASKQNNDQPILYYSNFSIVDAKLDLLREWGQDRTVQTLVENLVGNKIAGCVTMINAKLAEEYISYDFSSRDSYHDSYLAMLALATGKLIYLDYASILYRQHGTNLVGAGKRSDRVQSFWNMIKASGHRAEDIVKKYSKLISEENLIILTEFYQLCSEKLFFKRLHTVLKYSYKRVRKRGAENLILKVLLITNYHHK